MIEFGTQVTTGEQIVELDTVKAIRVFGPTAHQEGGHWSLEIAIETTEGELLIVNCVADDPLALTAIPSGAVTQSV